jgi:hypothetical protein
LHWKLSSGIYQPKEQKSPNKKKNGKQNISIKDGIYVFLMKYPVEKKVWETASLFMTIYHTFTPLFCGYHS